MQKHIDFPDRKSAIGLLAAGMMVSFIAPVQASSVGFLRANLTKTAVILNSSGVTSATVTSPGVFSIVFARNISSCTRTVTVNSPLPMYATATVTPSANTTLIVRTFNKAGAPTAAAFQAVIVCGP